MQKQYSNKGPDAIPKKDKSIKQPFFFAGGGEFKPVTIEATSIEEATQQWEQVREKVNN